MISTFASPLGPSTTITASLPRGLREEAESISVDAFHATYAPTSGPLRLGNWECTDERTGTLGPQARTYQATIALGDSIGTSTAVAAGPIGALTAMLHERGIAVEMLGFHQKQLDGATATFIRGTDGYREDWAMGWSEDSTQSALRAVIACANRLYATAS
ncbi:MAG: homocitrate synthase [Mycolicibacterium sp.]|nr:homocitrate synthase [Mycolicibacterium sp.]